MALFPGRVLSVHSLVMSGCICLHNLSHGLKCCVWNYRKTACGTLYPWQVVSMTYIGLRLKTCCLYNCTLNVRQSWFPGPIKSVVIMDLLRTVQALSVGLEALVH